MTVKRKETSVVFDQILAGKRRRRTRKWKNFLPEPRPNIYFPPLHTSIIPHNKNLSALFWRMGQRHFAYLVISPTPFSEERTKFLNGWSLKKKAFRTKGTSLCRCWVVGGQQVTQVYFRKLHFVIEVGRRTRAQNRPHEIKVWLIEEETPENLGCCKIKIWS